MSGFIRVVMVGIVSLCFFANAYAFHTENYTNMYLSLSTSLWEGIYAETVGPAVIPGQPPPTISNGWPTADNKNVSVQWGVNDGKGSIVLIGSIYTCKLCGGGWQKVTGYCDIYVDSNGEYACRGQGSPNVQCIDNCGSQKK